MATLFTVILFLIVLAILIFVHELGHFLAARAFGIRVDEFSLGFGPKIFGWKRGETTYLLKAVPFGGYVKIFGENPDEDSTNGPDNSRSFVHKAKWKQIVVLAAGITFNFIFAWLVISATFMAGAPRSVESYPQYADRMSNPGIIITAVEPKSPAETAGIKAGDWVVGFSTIPDLQNAVNESKDKGIELKVRRGGVEETKNVVAKEGIAEGKYAIGINLNQAAFLKLPLHLALYEGAIFTGEMMKVITVGLYDLIVGMFNGTSKLSSVTGPIGIAGLVSDAAKIGFTYLMMFTAVISINLGIINLVPFPALDGGRILFVLIEAVIRRPIKPAIANSINIVGFFLLILLMIVVTYRDILKFF